MVIPLLLALALSPQEEISVSSVLEPTVIKLGDVALLRVEVSGGEDAEIGPLPEVKGCHLRRAGPPARSERLSIVNRTRRHWISLVYTIVAAPDAEGEYDLPPIPVTVRGRPFETKPVRLTVVRDFRGASLAFLDVAGPKRAVFRGEVFRIDATFGIREDLVAARAVSEPALRAAWAEDLRDAVRLEIPPPSREAAQQIGLNGRAAYVSRIVSIRRGEAGFVAWRLSVPFVASFPGRIPVGKTFFVFERIVRRGSGFFGQDEGERMFLDAPAFEVEVKELPEEGRPEGFGGAIGRFGVETDANPRDVKVGESIRLVLRISGEGNLGFLEPPDLERAAGFERFRFFGRLEEKGEGKREVVYDLAPLGEDASTLPSVLFPYFDPEEGAYRTAKTDPIPLRVRPLPPGERLPDLPGTATESAPKDDLRDAKPVFSVRPRAEDLSSGAAVVAFLPPLAWFGALALRRRRQRRERDPGGWRRRRAASGFRGRAAALRPRFEAGDPREACAELARTVAAYLADREGTAAEAVIGADVAARLRARGEPEALSRAFAELLEACDRATFAGQTSPGEGRALLERTLDLVERMEKEGAAR